MERNILTSSIQNASFSIICQIVFRIITFSLNVYLIRNVEQKVLGIINVRLLVLESIISLLSKEPMKKIYLIDLKSHNWAQAIDLIWLSVPVCAGFSWILVCIWIDYLPTDEEIQETYFNQYKYACISIGVSCVIEQCTQCAVLVAQAFCFVTLKIVIEAIYILSETLIFVFLIIIYHTESINWAINAFLLAQILSAIIMCALYYGFFLWYIPKLNKFNLENNGSNNNNRNTSNNKLFSSMMDFPFRSILDLLPSFMHNENWAIDFWYLVVLFKTFGIEPIQSLIKDFLTGGERYVMAVFPVLMFSEQSAYDTVNNLGSLAPRLVFRPIEESAYFYFTQTIKRNTPLVRQRTQNITEAAEVLGQLCTIVTSIGLLVVAFGQSYSSTLLYLYGGENLVPAFEPTALPVTLLQYYCIGIVLLAINGITEAYVLATINNQQLKIYYIQWMPIFSMIFLMTWLMLTMYLGACGIIVANCLNMGARIIHHLIFIYNKYNGTSYKPLNGLKPSMKYVISLVISGILTKYSETKIQPKSVFLHISFGTIFFLITIFVWCMENRNLLNRYRNLLNL